MEYKRDLTRSELALKLMVTVKSIENYMTKGLPYDNTNPKHILFSLPEVANWLQLNPQIPGRKKNENPELEALKMKKLEISIKQAIFNYDVENNKYYLKEDIQKERLLKVEAIKQGLNEMISNLPARLYSKDEAQIQYILEEEVDNLLNLYSREEN